MNKMLLILTGCCMSICAGYSQTLQSVTDEGKVTTNDVTIEGNTLTVASGPTTSGGHSGLQVSSTGTNTNGGYTSINSFYSGIGWFSPLVLQHYNTEANVGIGITKPGAKLTLVKNGTDPGGYDDTKTLFVTGLYGSGQQYDGGIEFRHDNLSQGIGFGYNTIYQTGFNASQELNLIAKGNGPITLNSVGGATGNVGIGNLNPGAKLTIIQGGTEPGSFDDNKAVFVTGGYGSGQLYDGGVEFRHDNLTQGIGFGYNTIYQTGTNPSEGLNLIGKGNGNITLNAVGESTGNVGIGTTDTRNYKLAVNGSIRAKEIKVEAAPWPDYVFHSSYKLPDLKDTEQFIKENQHLPEIPSAAEVAKDGVNLGEMNAKLLKKIEEVTLYLIEFKKEINEIREENLALKDKVVELQKNK